MNIHRLNNRNLSALVAAATLLPGAASNSNDELVQPYPPLNISSDGIQFRLSLILFFRRRIGVADGTATSEQRMSACRPKDSRR
jgi:hypothetical protein